MPRYGLPSVEVGPAGLGGLGSTLKNGSSKKRCAGPTDSRPDANAPTLSKDVGAILKWGRRMSSAILVGGRFVVGEVCARATNSSGIITPETTPAYRLSSALAVGTIRGHVLLWTA